MKKLLLRIKKILCSIFHKTSHPIASTNLKAEESTQKSGEKKYTDEELEKFKHQLELEKQEEIDKLIDAHKDEIKKIMSDKNDSILHHLRLYNIIIDMATDWLTDYSLASEGELKQQLENKLRVFFDIVHFDNSKEDYFELELTRKRVDSDPQDTDIIETCPALFLKFECVVKGKYVKIINE